MESKVTTIDQYITAYPAEVQDILQKVRKTIAKAAPEATEKIGYGIPTFVFHGNLVHFAAYAHHIGFYPGSGAIEIFQNELTQYKTSRGAIQFPLAKPIPYDLIQKITSYRYQENTSKLRK